MKILEFKFHTLIEIRQLGLGFCLCSVLCAKKWSLMQKEIRMNILLLIHSSWQCLWKKTHQKDCVNYCAQFYRPKQATTQGKVLGNGWISNREHFLWWPLAAPSVMGLFIFNCSTVVLVWGVVFSWAGTSSFNLCMSLYIVFLLQFSKNFMGHYWVTKMGADFASLCQKIFITAIILREIMFQQVQAVCKTWHMCELAISHRSYNIVSNNKTKWETVGRGMSYRLIWSWNFEMWSSLEPGKQSAALFLNFQSSHSTREVPTAWSIWPVCKSLGRVSMMRSL